MLFSGPAVSAVHFSVPTEHEQEHSVLLTFDIVDENPFHKHFIFNGPVNAVDREGPDTGVDRSLAFWQKSELQNNPGAVFVQHELKTTN